jgi:hypothetical protein
MRIFYNLILKCLIDMKKLLLGIVFFSFVGFMSCGLFDELIPDVDTSYTSEFVVSIVSNAGETVMDNINITDSQDYQDFKDNIKGYKITKITYSVKTANIPDDMYLSGVVKCYSSDETEEVSVGTIAPVKLFNIVDISEEQDVVQLNDGINKVIDWLDAPGSFKMNATYNLKDASGGAYSISGTEGYGFTLKLKFYVTVETGA